MKPIKEVVKNSDPIGNFTKGLVQAGVKGSIDGSCFISPKLLLVSSGEVIEFDTYEEYRAYIEENNLEERDYKDCSSGMYFHVKYKSPFKPDRCL